MHKRSGGFTIVELLIVIVVIGILAAITIVAFNGIQNRATATTIKNDLAQIHKKIELYKAETSNYPVGSTATLEATDIRISKASYLTPTDRNQFYYCLGPTGDTYAVGAISKNNVGYIMTNGVIEEVGTGASVYGSNTCVRAGHPSGSGSPLSGWVSGTTPAWASWVKG